MDIQLTSYFAETLDAILRSFYFMPATYIPISSLILKIVCPHLRAVGCKSSLHSLSEKQ